ncbi:hypothetical protein PR202_gb15952 [Eleusine coracana subsp. coracana]|uniref:Exonuclease domain-containing protein n=1 Tax=Eleusine coracana subsp. coracana TaxID=191504 RepID=A0AAV5EYY6_ELECO|nr:hypothetical protein PR202_gb15952 [Eleusine coracana subsp. coracana]
MSSLANMFAVLDLDAEDDREEVEKPTPSNTEAAEVTPKPVTLFQRRLASFCLIRIKNHIHIAERSSQSKTMIVNYDGENLAPSSSDYKLPLVWIDLEMTGLDITKDRILEIACIITDGKLTKQIEVDIETKYFYYLAVMLPFLASFWIFSTWPMSPKPSSVSSLHISDVLDYVLLVVFNITIALPPFHCHFCKACAGGSATLVPATTSIPRLRNLPSLTPGVNYTWS